MADKAICNIDGCNNPVLVASRGLCGVHYRRMRRYGDANRPSPRDVPRLFYEAMKSHTGDECVEWPYSRIVGGYAVMSINNRTKVVSRALCEHRHGPPPENNSEAAHNCGHSWCVNPLHVEWKTPKENSADRIRHKTLLPGRRRRLIRRGNKKLTPPQVAAIQTDGRLQREIAAEYGVCVHTVRKAQRGLY